MPKADLYNMEGSILGQVSLKEDIFGQSVSEGLLYEVVRAYLLNQRLGCASTKGKAEVRGGGRKPWRQKGTGRARAGSTRSPLWKGGGTIFGPQPGQHRIRISAQAKQKALRGVLSEKVEQGNFRVLETLNLNEAKTSAMVELLNRLQLNRPLIVLDGNDQKILMASKNIKGLKVTGVDNLNPYLVIKHEKVLMTKAALARLEDSL
ncbi:MAG: 50S ribosomal protein L4 [bacterium]